MKKFSLLVALIAVLAYAGWRMGYVKPPFMKTAEQQEGAAQGGAGGGRGGFDGPVVITAFDLRNADMPVTLDAIGTAQALNTVTVRSQVDGKLIEVNFKEGQDVKAGDVLARIDPTTYQAQYDQAVAKKAQDEALLVNAKIDLERYTRLAQGNFGPKQQADTQRAVDFLRAPTTPAGKALAAALDLTRVGLLGHGQGGSLSVVAAAGTRARAVLAIDPVDAVGVPGAVQLRMIANVALDATLGAVPVAGDLFDAVFKAHQRNHALLERWLGQPRRVETMSRLALWAVPVAALLAIVATLGLAIAAALWSWDYLVSASI